MSQIANALFCLSIYATFVISYAILEIRMQTFLQNYYLFERTTVAKRERPERSRGEDLSKID
jgi:hypothetical protein